ncbi:MAG: carbamoyltransferase [Acidipila sp.]|nr:carbamoyltransferase [Acidipila sp.]
MTILGIAGFEHDATAALIGEAGVIAAIEEDKLARTPRMGGVPHLAIDFVMRRASARPADLLGVAVATCPRRAWLREERFRMKLVLSRPASAYQTGSLGRVYRSYNHLRSLRRQLVSGPHVLQFEHHLCHAASAYYPSPFDGALVLTLDEAGDMWSGTVAIGEGDELRIIETLKFPDSLGWFYTRVTELLGLRPHLDEQKTLWLGRNGTTDLVEAFRHFFHTETSGLPHLNREYFGGGVGGEWSFSAQARRELGISGKEAPQDSAHRATIARSAQAFLEETVLALAEHYRKKTGAKNLAVAGGVFLNVLLVRALEKRGGFEEVFVQPAAGNAGTALGAALLGRKQLTGQSGRRPLVSLDWGPEFDPSTLKEVLDNSKIIYRYLPVDDELFAETVRLLNAGQIVAWCQGRLEFGWRALGHRSLLASPYAPFVTENLNRYIKHREDFHPFALSVPAERAPELFEATGNCRFLASLGELRAGVQGLDEFTFLNRQVRVHIVEREAAPRFWKLLQAFGATAPAPVLINASFNLFGEPLVAEPRDAIRSFYCSGTDAMVLGNYLITKSYPVYPVETHRYSL